MDHWIFCSSFVLLFQLLHSVYNSFNFAASDQLSLSTVGFKFQLLLSQVGINYQPPTAVPGGDFAKVHRSHLRFKDFFETVSN